MRVTAWLLALAMSVALSSAAAPGPEPGPPPKGAAALYGTWKARGRLRDGAMRDYLATYTFAEGKATLVSGNVGVPREMTLEVDKAQKGLIEMKQPRGRTMRYFYKIEKGELYLVLARVGKTDVRPDFSCKASPVIVLTREKK